MPYQYCFVRPTDDVFLSQPSHIDTICRDCHDKIVDEWLKKTGFHFRDWIGFRPFSVKRLCRIVHRTWREKRKLKQKKKRTEKETPLQLQLEYNRWEIGRR